MMITSEEREWLLETINSSDLAAKQVFQVLKALTMAKLYGKAVVSPESEDSPIVIISYEEETKREITPSLLPAQAAARLGADFPAMQIVQVSAASAAARPEMQSKHSVACETFWKVPLGQLSQVYEDCAEENRPGVHARQAPSFNKVPASQNAHGGELLVAT